MGDLVSLRKARDDRTPHLAGKARCLACSREWEAVAQVGAIWLECPSCHCEKGLLAYPVEKETSHWKCACGNQLFCVTPEGIYCPLCGETQAGY